MQDVVNISNEIFDFVKERDYELSPLIHSLIFMLEAVTQSYNVPNQQIARIRRVCRKYITEMAEKEKITIGDKHE